MTNLSDSTFEQVAIIGMAVRFPSVNTTDQYWQLLRNGEHVLTTFTDEELLANGVSKEELSNPNYVKASIILENIDRFDATFFGYNAREAEMLDPQHRIFLELSFEALENAGCNPDSYAGAIGVFAGSSPSDYVKGIPCGLDSITSGLEAFHTSLSNDLDYLATRISYKLNLTGPSLTLQTACSTSLVALHTACQYLLTYQCDAALAGGVSIRLPQEVGYIYREGMIWSPDGYCRAFDANSQGTIFGRGAGIVVLKRLSEAISDGDHIHAVIKGSAINNDGALKVGFTAPSVGGQAQVVSAAQAISEVTPETISYIETHGTGTKLGDPIEIEALTEAFSSYNDKKGYCAVGSVKTNFGHLDAAAGIAGLIKTVLALKNKEIPPSLHFEKPNPNIIFDNTPFYVVRKLEVWNKGDTPRRAGVSSFGIGGTNAHVILEEAPLFPAPSASRSLQLLLLSAKSTSALKSISNKLGEFIQNTHEISLPEVTFTLQTGRKRFEYRRMVVCNNAEEASKSLIEDDTSDDNICQAAPKKTKMVFMFSGQGSQYIDMCRGLYDEEVNFRKQIDQCSKLLLPHLSFDIRNILFPTSNIKEAKQEINQTYITQPALFTIEYSLANLLRTWGLEPQALVGHSIGEYVAACISGVFSLEEAIALVATRGQMMQNLAPGSMLAVPLSEEEVIHLIPDGLSIAVINSPKMTVVSGQTNSIESFRETLLEQKGVECRQLHTSHAFHSEMMEPIVDNFTQLASSFSLRPPQIPFVSNVTGNWILPEQATSPDYWGAHLRQTVRFSSCLTTLLDNNFQQFLEVGPGQVLTMLTKQHPESKDKVVLPTTRRPVERKKDLATLLDCIGQLWCAGIELDWGSFYSDESRYKIPLPPYPFEKRPCWISANLSNTRVSRINSTSHDEISQQNEIDVGNLGAHENKLFENEVEKELVQKVDNSTYTETEMLLVDIWNKVLGVDSETAFNNYYNDLGGDSLSALKIVSLINEKTGIFLEPFSIMLNKIATIAIDIDNKLSTLDDKFNENKDTHNIKPFFFGDIGKELCGLYHNPTNIADRKEGVLLCHPLPQEYMHCYWSMRVLSDLLAEKGFHVLRFDYFGTGDSTGDSKDVSIQQWKDDITIALKELSNKTDIEKISVIGLRFGALLAFQTLIETEIKCNELILWDPVIDGKNHVEELKIINEELLKIGKPKGKNNKISYINNQLIGYPFPEEHSIAIRQINLFNLSVPDVNKLTIASSKPQIEHERFYNHILSNSIRAEHHIADDISTWGKPESVMSAQFPSKILNKMVSVLAEN